MKTIKYKLETLMQKLMSKDYRFEPIEEFKYPIYKRCIYKDNVYNGCVVKFTGETEGVIVKDTERTLKLDPNSEYRLYNWLPHTDTNSWEDYDYEETIAYYRWERLLSIGKILVSDLISDKYAERHKYKEDGWVKRTNTKRTWEY